MGSASLVATLLCSSAKTHAHATMSSSSTQRPINISVAGRYRLGRKIGSGSFGDLFVGACMGVWAHAGGGRQDAVWAAHQWVAPRGVS